MLPPAEIVKMQRFEFTFPEIYGKIHQSLFAEVTDMGYVFISYSSINRESADKIRHIFSRSGVDSWIAPDDIPAGSEYAGVINKAIKNCACLVLLLTKDSMRSQWVAKEVERAINYKKPVIPVQLEAVSLTDQFELYISTNQILALSKVDEATPEMQHLITVVQRLVAVSAYEKSTLIAEIMRETMSSTDMIVEPQKPVPVQNKKSRLSFVIIAALCGILAIVILILLLPGASNEKDNSIDTPAITTTENQTPSEEQPPESQTPPEKQPTQNVQDTPSKEETTPVSGTNEVPSVYEDEITELKEGSELALRNCTIRVKVGQSVAPLATQVWTSATIYSQDTSIAVGEGTSVKGVSKGETYVIVEATLGIAQVYYVIVE